MTIYLTPLMSRRASGDSRGGSCSGIFRQLLVRHL
eukprot:COSAG05_NODE_23870_length_255_cov_0.660256_2_plen_34_part_01